jgi:hypothetical protein
MLCTQAWPKPHIFVSHERVRKLQGLHSTMTRVLCNHMIKKKDPAVEFPQVQCGVFLRLRNHARPVIAHRYSGVS